MASDCAPLRQRGPGLVVPGTVLVRHLAGVL
jgi:hypothetical protein